MSSALGGGVCPGKHAITVAYRNWLLREARVEAESEFGRILAVKSEVSVYLRYLCAEWSVEKRKALLHGLIKRRERRYAAPLTLSSEEEEACAEFDWPIRSWRTSGPSVEWRTRDGRSLEIDKSKVGIAAQRERSLAGEFRVSRSALKKCLRETLSPVLGRRLGDGGEWRYLRQVGPVTVCTDVDVGATGARQLRYEHWFVAGDNAERVSHTNERVLLSNMSLFGVVGAPETTWYHITDAGIADAAAVLARLCGEFLAAAPEILAEAEHVQSRIDASGSR